MDPPWWYHLVAAVGSDEFLRSTRKQRDSSRLAATSKNPRNLFGLESNELAQKSDPIRACTATVLTLVDILVMTKMSYFKGDLLPDRGSRSSSLYISLDSRRTRVCQRRRHGVLSLFSHRLL